MPLALVIGKKKEEGKSHFQWAKKIPGSKWGKGTTALPGRLAAPASWGRDWGVQKLRTGEGTGGSGVPVRSY